MLDNHSHWMKLMQKMSLRVCVYASPFLLKIISGRSHRPKSRIRSITLPPLVGHQIGTNKTSSNTNSPVDTSYRASSTLPPIITNQVTSRPPSTLPGFVRVPKQPKKTLRVHHSELNAKPPSSTDMSTPDSFQDLLPLGRTHPPATMEAAERSLELGRALERAGQPTAAGRVPASHVDPSTASHEPQGQIQQ